MLCLEILIRGNIEGSKLASNKEGIAILVDVLRASTTIPIAMQKGIKKFYVAKEVEDARLTQKELETMLMGERGCLKLSGFDYGNSPTEIFNETSFAKEVAAFTSSTGAKRIVDAIGSKYLIIGSIVNAAAVVKKCIELTKNNPLTVVIVPTFTHGPITDNTITEDQIGALLIAREFNKVGMKLELKTQNEIKLLEEHMKNLSIEEILLATDHGQKLIDLGFAKDIEFCSRLNFTSKVPISENNVYELSNKKKIVTFY